MSAINYGLANEKPQPVIAPTADKLARMKSGAPVPCRPEWLCITSPEHSVGSRLTGHDAKDLSPEESEAFEAAEREKVKAREAKAEARKLQADAARVEKKIQAAKDKRAREELAKRHKAAGFKRRKPEDKIIYEPHGHKRKASWA